MKRPAVKPLIHLRQREDNITGGRWLVSACGVRELASVVNNRYITKNGQIVTCPKCKERQKGTK